jgi:hypothetical protein
MGERLENGIEIFSTKNGKKIIKWEQKIFVHHRILLAVKTVHCVNDRMSYVELEVRWCNIVVLNVHAARVEKSDDQKIVSMMN